MPSTNNNSISIIILTVAAFIVVTTEYVIVGLLPELSRDFNISIPMAGQLVTLFALTVMLFGPFLTVVLAHYERKKLFIVILIIFALSNVLAALSTNIWLLAIARFIPALALPVFWGTASETAAQIAGPAKAGRAVSQVYLGISAALLFGVPIGTLMSNAFGWRFTFWALAVLSIFIALMIAFYMPKVEKPIKMNIAKQASILLDMNFVSNVVLSILVFTAMFTAYTYFADILESIAHIQPKYVGWWLMGFGAIGLFGNYLGGRMVDKQPLKTTLIFTTVLAFAMVISLLVVQWLIPFILALAVWGIAYTGLFPICQVRVIKSASHAQALAGTLNVSAANAGIALGALLGGFIIDHLGLIWLTYGSTLIAVMAIILTMAMMKKQR